MKHKLNLAKRQQALFNIRDRLVSQMYGAHDCGPLDIAYQIATELQDQIGQHKLDAWGAIK
jgi:hypothetical protein